MSFSLLNLHIYIYNAIFNIVHAYYFRVAYVQNVYTIGAETTYKTVQRGRHDTSREKNITWNFLQCRRWQLPPKIHLVADYAGMVILTFVANGFGWF